MMGDNLRQRIKLTIEYDGTYFCGWQRQQNGISIQELLEDALCLLFEEKINTFVAGRTDSGVHAIGQVVHFDFNKKNFPPFKIKSGLNYYLRQYPIVILDAQVVPDNWHARFSENRKTYIYKIINRQERLALERHRAWFVFQLLDVEKMRLVAQSLIGFHDFFNFRSSECKALTSKKTLDSIKINKNGDEIFIEFVSRSFLHHQVRIMSGFLKQVGTNEVKTEQIQNIFKQKVKNKLIAPPWGLYLKEIKYL